MLHIGKIKINIPISLLVQGKSQHVKLITDNDNNNNDDDDDDNNNNNSSNDITKVVPSLTDIEFSWTEDH